MQSDDHDVPHSPEWNSHLPQPIRHICLPTRALVPTGCAFNRHRFLPPKKYHRKKKKATKKEREQQLETKSKKERHHRTRAQCKKPTTQWTYLNWPDSPLSFLLLLPPLRLWQEASLIRLLLKLALSSLNLEDEREREREREREAKQETRNPVLGCQVGQARYVAQDATPWAPSPRAAIVQTKDTSGPNYGNTSP
jgi:hypothetical protein